MEGQEIMKARDYILAKQIQWARNHGINLIGSKGGRGRLAYTQKLEENLFEPLSSSTCKALSEGDGGELNGIPAKMQAVHSSSALGANIFQYWQKINQPEIIAHACGFCKRSTNDSINIQFEVKYSIDERFAKAPNIDVVLENRDSARHKVYAIESKFTEPYGGRRHGGIKEKYLDLEIWEKIPQLHKVAISISPDDGEYTYLHAAQLIKHILGLMKAFGKRSFRLCYLWYDALGYEGWKHRGEIEKFMTLAKSDGILIHSLSYQELIIKLANKYQDVHPEYVEYISTRYL